MLNMINVLVVRNDGLSIHKPQQTFRVVARSCSMATFKSSNVVSVKLSYLL